MKTDLMEKVEQLEKLTREMDVPEFRRSNIKWLLKNLGMRNSNHPNFDKAMEIVKDLNSNGVGGV